MAGGKTGGSRQDAACVQVFWCQKPCHASGAFPRGLCPPTRDQAPSPLCFLDPPSSVLCILLMRKTLVVRHLAVPSMQAPPRPARHPQGWPPMSFLKGDVGQSVRTLQWTGGGWEEQDERHQRVVNVTPMGAHGRGLNSGLGVREVMVSRCLKADWPAPLVRGVALGKPLHLSASQTCLSPTPLPTPASLPVPSKKF